MARKLNLDGNFMERFFSNLCHKYLNMPRAATWEEWSIWHKASEKEHKILYTLFHSIPRFFGVRWYRVTQDYYHLKSKYITKPHHIKIEIERFSEHPGIHNYHWFDVDTKMLYGMFQLLVDFVEKEEAGEVIDWNSDPEHKKVWAEVQELYNWWLERKNRDNGYPDRKDFDLEDREMFDFSDDKDDPNYRRYQTAVKEAKIKDDEFEVEDTEMLIRLVTMRKWLWT